MKRRSMFVVTLVGVLVLALQAGARLLEFHAGDVLRAIDLNAIVQALTGTPDPTPIPVNCPDETITDALRTALPGSTLHIVGTCTETVTITTDRVTLDGQGTAILDGGGGEQAVITVDGARGVTITGFTIRNGFDGILARRGAAVVLHSLTIEDNTDEGIQIDENSTAQLTECTIRRSGDDGLLVFRSSSVTLNSAITSTANSGHGILVSSASSAFLTGTVAANENQEQGILVDGASSLLTTSQTTVHASNNGSRGIMVLGSSKASFSGATVTTNTNGSWGIQVSQSSFLTINANGSVSSAGNALDGIGVFDGGGLLLSSGATILSENNARSGINLFTEATIITLEGSTLTLRNNPGNGLFMSDGSSVRIDNSTITGNGGIDIRATFGSRLIGNGGNTVGVISCDNTVLSQGDILCP